MFVQKSDLLQTDRVHRVEREKRQQKAERESVFLSMRRASQAETAREPTLLYCTLAICFVCFKCSKDEIRNAMI